MEQKPLVTVLVWTYNHESTIRDTLEGILMQRTDFPFDCFVLDDASTDGTSDIVREYVSRYPGVIRAHINAENLYRKPNRRDEYARIEGENLFGKYVALCEGDDYWTDANKLQTQVRFMELHEEYTFTAHSGILHDCVDGSDTDFVIYPQDCEIPMFSFFTLRKGAPHTASLVFRREVYLNWRNDKTYPRCEIGDFPLMMFALTRGKCFYFSKVMSVYRYKKQNSWTGRTGGLSFIRFSIGYLQFWADYDRYTNHLYTEGVRIFSNQQLITTIDRIASDGIDETQFRTVLLSLEEEHPEYDRYLKSLMHECEIILGNKGISSEERRQLQAASHIVIFGMGKYASAVERILKEHSFATEGYLVSQKASASDEPKPVWDFASLPYSAEEVVVVVGVSYSWKCEVEPLLQDRNYRYIAPLWRDLCSWL